MSYRSAEIAVQPETRNRLWLVFELYPEQAEYKTTVPNYGTEQEVRIRKMTVDEWADRALNEHIKEKYPNVLKYERMIAGFKYKYSARLRRRNDPVS